MSKSGLNPDAKPWGDQTEEDNAKFLEEKFKALQVKDEEAKAAPGPADGGKPVMGGLDPRDQAAKVVRSGNADLIYKSISSFDELGLTEPLKRGVLAKGFKTPSRIQAEALPIVLEKGHPNFIGQAHHGSGKTATYSLAMLMRVDEAVTKPQALCVCPTRELAVQVHTVVTELGQYTGIKAFAAVRDAEARKVTEQIVIGTPGTIIGMLKKKLLVVDAVRVMVLDEADVMIDRQGQGADTIKIKKSLPKSVQVLLFSATYADRVRNFAKKTAPDAVQIVVKREQLSLDAIKQYYTSSPDANAKYQLLSDMYGMLTLGQSIIFVRRRRTANELRDRMRAEGFKVSMLHGGETTKARDDVMNDFREGKTTVLITTDVLARGIDVPQVNMVVNYELPANQNDVINPETYIHRIGRSGRFGRDGVAISMVHDDAGRAGLKKISDHYQHAIEELPVDGEKIAEIVKKALNIE